MVNRFYEEEENWLLNNKDGLMVRDQCETVLGQLRGMSVNLGLKSAC